MSNDKKQTALAILEQLKTGAFDETLFTPDAHWWANTGHSFPLAQFVQIIGALAATTVDGIKIDPGLVLEDGDHVVVEATSNIPLVDGKVYANRYLFLFVFADGLVREVKEYNDTAHVAESFDLAAIL